MEWNHMMLRMCLYTYLIVSTAYSFREHCWSRPLQTKARSIVELRALTSGEVNVRFINTKSGVDVVYTAHQGENLLKVADKAGVNIPRSCRADTCGTCTVDMCDPNAAKYTDAKGMTNREGHQTIRACVAKVVVPDGMEEMVIDVFRTKLISEANAAAKGGAASNPMARFSVDWESKYQGLQTEAANEAAIVKTALMEADDMYQESLAHAQRFRVTQHKPKSPTNFDLTTSRSSLEESGERKDSPIFTPLSQQKIPKKRFSRKDWKN